MTHPCLPDQNRPVTGNTVAKPTYLVLHAILRFCIRFPLYSMALYQGVGLGGFIPPEPGTCSFSMRGRVGLEMGSRLVGLGAGLDRRLFVLFLDASLPLYSPSDATRSTCLARFCL